MSGSQGVLSGSRTKYQGPVHKRGINWNEVTGHRRDKTAGSLMFTKPWLNYMLPLVIIGLLQTLN